MALIDPSAVRCASVVALAEVVVASVAEPQFTALAQSHQSLLGSMTVGTTGPVMMPSGASIHLLSIPLRRKASDEAERAIRWNNAGLRREP